MRNTCADLIDKVHEVFLAKEKSHHQIRGGCSANVCEERTPLIFYREGDKNGYIGEKDNYKYLSIVGEEVVYALLVFVALKQDHSNLRSRYLVNLFPCFAGIATRSRGKSDAGSFVDAFSWSVMSLPCKSSLLVPATVCSELVFREPAKVLVESRSSLVFSTPSRGRLESPSPSTDNPLSTSWWV